MENRIQIDVRVENTEEVIKCWTYVLKADHKGVDLELKPSLAYKKVIIKGALEQRLPPDYIAYVQSVPDNGILDTGAPH